MLVFRVRIDGVTSHRRFPAKAKSNKRTSSVHLEWNRSFLEPIRLRLLKTRSATTIEWATSHDLRYDFADLKLRHRKCQLERRGIHYEALDNGISWCEDLPAAPAFSAQERRAG